MNSKLRQELEAMKSLQTGDSFTAEHVHTLVDGILEGGGKFKYVNYDSTSFPYPQTIGSTADSIVGLGNADESMIDTIFIMPNKETDSTATMMIVVDEIDPPTNPKTYQYVYVGNINDLPSDVLTEGSIVDNLTTGGTDKPLSAEQGRTLNSHVNYTTCESGASDQVKLISDDGFELSTHLRLLVKMNNTNTHATPKFNINNTGIKDVWYNGSVASDTNTWSAGEVLDIYYDGTKYITNTHGGAQFSTGEKVGDVGIDDEPTAGSDNLVKSDGVYEKISQLGQEVDKIDVTIGNNDGVICDGTYNKNTILFTLKNVNVGDILYLERSAGDNRVTFFDEDNIEINNTSSYPNTKRVPINFAYAKLDYGGGASSTIKVTDKSQIAYVLKEFSETVDEINDYLSYNTSSKIEVTEERNNGYIDNYGTKHTDSTGDFFTNPIAVNKSDILVFQAKGGNNAALSITDSTGSFYNVVLRGSGSDVRSLTWMSPKDCYVCISSVKSGVSNIVSIYRYTTLDKFENFSLQRYVNGVYDFGDAVRQLNAEVLRDDGLKSGVVFSKEVSDKLYIGLKVRFPKNVHDISETIGFLAVDNFQVYLKKAQTSVRDTGKLVPCPVYNTCLYGTGGENYEEYRLQPDGWNTDFLLGKDPFSIRFKGDCSVAVNQDIRLKIDDTSVSIYHSTNNTVIATYTKANFQTLKDLYLAMEADTATGEALENFELEWFNLNEYIPDDIIMCDVALVAQYTIYQDGDTDSHPSLSHYDSFPFYFTTKEDGRVYDVEVVFDKNNNEKVQLIIDGYGIPVVSPNITYNRTMNDGFVRIRIGSSLSSSDIEILSFEVSDELNYKHPNLRVYYSENTQPGMNSGSSYYTSQERVAEVATILEKNNFGTINFDDIIQYLDGSLPLKGNIYHFSHDDAVASYFANNSVLNTFISHNIMPSYGLQMQASFNEDSVKKMLALFRIGFYYFPHGFSYQGHQGSLGHYSFEQMVEIINASKTTFFNTFGIWPKVWDFHSTAETYNQVRYMINHGFVLIFGDNGLGLLTKINRYRCGRLQVNDSQDLNKIKSRVDNYIR